MKDIDCRVKIDHPCHWSPIIRFSLREGGWGHGKIVCLHYAGEELANM